MGIARTSTPGLRYSGRRLVWSRDIRLDLGAFWRYFASLCAPGNEASTGKRKLIATEGNQMKNYFLALALILLTFSSVAAQTAPVSTSPRAVQQTAGPSAAPASGIAIQAETQPKVTAYTLPPQLYQKAHNLGRIHFRFQLISFVYGLFVLWLILRWKLAPKYRDWAERFSSKRFLQSVVFSPLLLLTMAVLALPADLYDQWISRKYGLSV